MIDGVASTSIVETEDDAVEVIAPPRFDLTPRQFTWLLAYTGLENVWKSIEETARVNNRSLYAKLKAQKASERFIFQMTIDFIASVSEIASQLHPDVDLSEKAIGAAWDLALEQDFSTLI